jgi:hypothetical protein
MAACPGWTLGNLFTVTEVSHFLGRFASREAFLFMIAASYAGLRRFGLRRSPQAARRGKRRTIMRSRIRLDDIGAKPGPLICADIF